MTLNHLKLSVLLVKSHLEFQGNVLLNALKESSWLRQGWGGTAVRWAAGESSGCRAMRLEKSRSKPGWNVIDGRDYPEKRGKAWESYADFRCFRTSVSGCFNLTHVQFTAISNGIWMFLMSGKTKIWSKKADSKSSFVRQIVAQLPTSQPHHWNYGAKTDSWLTFNPFSSTHHRSWKFLEQVQRIASRERPLL